MGLFWAGWGDLVMGQQQGESAEEHYDGEKNMNQPWLYRAGMWLCDKLGHIGAKGWIYNGYYHRDCRICGRIVSEPLKDKHE